MALSNDEGIQENLYTGLAAGVSIDVPLKRADNKIVGIDYAYRSTTPFKGNTISHLDLASNRNLNT